MEPVGLGQGHARGPVAADSPSQRGGGRSVPSVIRAVRILNALAAGPSRASLASLSRRLQLPRSSTLALCSSLVETGLLTRGPDGLYRLGPHVLELSRSFLGQMDLPSEFQNVTSEFNILPGQTLACAVARELDVVYIARRNGSYPIGMSYEIGMRLPAHCTAAGQTILASLPDSDIIAHYAPALDEGLAALTAHSIVSLDELLRRIDDVRARGYAVTDEETLLGMLSIGAPIRDASSDPIGAVEVNIAKAGLQDREVPGIAADVIRLASEISRRLGGSS